MNNRVRMVIKALRICMKIPLDKRDKKEIWFMKNINRYGNVTVMYL